MIAAALALLVCAAPVDPTLVPGAPKLFVGHQGSVIAVAFSPDGKLLASGGFDKTVRLWDVATGKELRQLEGPKESISSVAFSPDGKVLAAGDVGLATNLWTIPDGKPVRVVHNAEPIAHVAFSPDGKLLAVGGISGTSEVFAVADGKELFEVRLRTPTFSKDGKTIAGTGKTGTLMLYDVAKAKLKKEHKGTSPASSLLSPDSKQLYAFDGEGKDVLVLDPATGATVGTISGATRGLSSVALSTDGALLATASVDKKVRIYELAKKTVIKELPLEKTGFVAFAPDKSAIAVGDGALVKLFALTP